MRAIIVSERTLRSNGGLLLGLQLLCDARVRSMLNVSRANYELRHFREDHPFIEQLAHAQPPISASTWNAGDGAAGALEFCARPKQSAPRAEKRAAATATSS